MHSRALRLFCALIAWIVLGGAGAFLFYSEQQLTDHRAALRAFDLHARELTDALSDLRAAQQAYVAAGQGSEFWLPRVAKMGAAVQAATTELYRSSLAPPARQSLDGAIDSVAQFLDADQRARDYLRNEETLKAADVIFSEGREVAVTAARQVESARLAEHQAVDWSEAQVRRQQALALAGAAGFVALVLLVLAWARPRARPDESAMEQTDAASSANELSLPLKMPDAKPAALPPPPARSVQPGLNLAADLCTEFGRVRSVEDLQPLIASACRAMDAAGLVVWLGSTAGADLEPVLAHGYSSDVMARMPKLPRNADNAAAAAYRRGEQQVVPSRPDGGSGALVVPMLSAQGPIGALSAELRDGTESSEDVQALARIVAAQLASVLTTSPDVADAAAEPQAAASR